LKIRKILQSTKKSKQTRKIPKKNNNKDEVKKDERDQKNKEKEIKKDKEKIERMKSAKTLTKAEIDNQSALNKPQSIQDQVKRAHSGDLRKSTSHHPQKKS